MCRYRALDTTVGIVAAPTHSSPSLFLSCTREVSYLVQVLNIDRDRNIRGIAVIEEMFQADLNRYRTDRFAEPRHLQIFDLPYFEHQRSELLADEFHLALIQINAIKVMVSQRFAYGIVGRGECIDQVENIGQVAPEVLFFARTKAECRFSSLLGQAGAIIRLQVVTSQFIAKPPQS